jgi:hypothetical protein
MAFPPPTRLHAAIAAANAAWLSGEPGAGARPDPLVVLALRGTEAGHIELPQFASAPFRRVAQPREVIDDGVGQPPRIAGAPCHRPAGRPGAAREQRHLPQPPNRPRRVRASFAVKPFQRPSGLSLSLSSSPPPTYPLIAQFYGCALANDATPILGVGANMPHSPGSISICRRCNAISVVRCPIETMVVFGKTSVSMR